MNQVPTTQPNEAPILIQPYEIHKQFAQHAFEMDLSEQGLLNLLVLNFGPTRDQVQQRYYEIFQAFQVVMKELEKARQERHLHAAYTTGYVQKLFKAIYGTDMPSALGGSNVVTAP